MSGFSDKPHKGKITNWSFVNEGRTVIGIHHGTGGFIRTGTLVNHNIGTGEIETRNSRYTLTSEPVPTILQSTARCFRLVRDRVIRDTTLAKAGSTVYRQTDYDYGLSADDTRYFNQLHVTVTLREDGRAPGFTVPMIDLEEIL